MTTHPIPLRPDYSAVASSQARSFWRGITATALGTLLKESPAAIIERSWRGDERAKLHTRAGTTQATTTTSGWAADLVGVSAAVLGTLAPASAAAQLAQRALPVSFGDGVNQVLMSKVATAPTGAWIAEGSPAAMLQPAFDHVVVGPPRKLLFGAAATNELQDYAIDTATAIIQRVLTDAASVALDSALLDNAAEDATRPAGLLNGVTPIGATAGGGVAALVADLASIAGAMSTAGVSAENLMLFANDNEAIKVRGLLTGPAFARYAIVGTPAVASGFIVGVAPQAIAMYAAPPEVEVSKEALVHMGTSPRNLDTQAVSEIVKSAWQTVLLLLKVRLRCTWKPLADGAVQLISSVSW